MSLGGMLRDARIASGYSISEISSRTLIREEIIHDLENNDFISSGGIAYARGHVRTIATFIGADVDGLMKEFNATNIPSKRSISDLLSENLATPATAKKSTLSFKVIGTIVVGIAIASFVVAFVVSALTSSPQTKVVQNNPVSASSPSDAPSPSPSQSVSPSASPTPSSAVTKTMTSKEGKVITFVAARARSWLSVYSSSGQRFYRQTMQLGESQSFTLTSEIQEISADIGNAGAVDFYIDGVMQGPTGDEFQVKHLTFTR